MSLVPATGGYVPQPAALQTACEMLTISRDPRDPRYAAAAAQLEALMVTPEFLVNLVYIFSRCTPAMLADDVRQLAGLVVKTGAGRAPLKALPADVQQFVKCELLEALSDPASPTVRATAGSVVTALVGSARTGVGAWPELLPRLVALLDAAAGGGSAAQVRTSRCIKCAEAP